MRAWRLSASRDPLSSLQDHIPKKGYANLRTSRGVLWRALASLWRRAGRVRLVTRCATFDTIVANVPKANCKAEMLVGVAVDAGGGASERMSDCDCAAVRLQLA
jgi:hypothetical protein